MPSIWISEFYLDRMHAQATDSKRFFVNLRQVIEQTYGPPPSFHGFESDAMML